MGRRSTASLLTAAIVMLFSASRALPACVGFVLADESGSCASARIAIPEGKGTAYRVGPAQAHTNLGDVPWSRLKAGDTVYIHYRSEPYREKILISGRGMPDQWIRVLGVPGPNGELPVISGDRAVTSKNVRFRWSKPDLIEWLGVVHVAVGVDQPGQPEAQAPAYIEIANLEIKDGFSTSQFRAANGAWLNYNGFAACIYARSVQHLVVRNNILHDCGQGFYNWTGDGSSPAWWSALQVGTIISGNYFYNNGNPGSYLEHQVYTESDGVTIEYNRFGSQRAGAKGSQIKDRSAGTVVRYNSIEQSRQGWDIDLVEPEETWASLGQSPRFKQTFVYGNVIVSRSVEYPNIVHWNEDHQAGRGRATESDGRLFFYHNTIVIFSERTGNDDPYAIFNATWGGYECPEPAPRGVIDVRNNIIAVIPVAPEAGRPPPIRLGYCRTENIELGPNWISPGVIRDGNVNGWSKLISPSTNDPEFSSLEDFRLREGAPSAVAGGELPPEAKSNSLGADLSPVDRFVDTLRLERRDSLGAGSRLGAY